MDFPKKQAQRLMPLYLLEYSEKLFTNHPDPSAPWGGGGGSDYTAGQGITITNNEISVDTNVIATKSDIPSLDGYATEQWVENQNYMKNDDPTWSSIFKGPTVYVGPGGTNGYTVYAPDRIVKHGGLNGSSYEYIFPNKLGTFAMTSDIITSYNDLTDKPELPDFTNYYYLNNEIQSGGYKTIIRDSGLEYSREFEQNRITIDVNKADLENNASIIIENNRGKKVAISNRIDVYNDATSGVSVEGEKVSIHAQNMHTTSLADGKLTYEDGLMREFNLPVSKEIGIYTLATTADIPNMDGYATETWVQNQGYATSSEIPTNYVTTDTEQTITGLKTIGQTSGTISEVDFSGFTFKLSNKAINHPEADIKIRNASYDGYQYPTIYSTKGLYVNLAKIKLGDDGNNTYGITMPDSSTWESDRVLATTNDIPTVNNPTITFTQGGTTKGTITLNQSGDQTIEFDAGSSSVDWQDITNKPSIPSTATSTSTSTVTPTTIELVFTYEDNTTQTITLMTGATVSTSTTTTLS